MSAPSEFAVEVGTMTGRCWLVAACFDLDTGALDEWQVFEDYGDAVTAYDSVIDAGAYVASIAAIVQSTDYDPDPKILKALEKAGAWD